MKWHNEPYGELKWRIFQEIQDGLLKEHSEKITMLAIMDEIDQFIFNLVDE